MTKNYHITIILLFPLFVGFSFNLITVNGQDTLQLFECYRYAIQHHPLSEQIQLFEEEEGLIISNHNTNWYPQVDLNARATYQSDVPRVEGINLPVQSGPQGNSSYEIDIPEPDHDQYKIAIDIKQTIYDGAATKTAKALEKINTKANIQNVRIEIDKVKSQLNEVYFSILLLNKQLKQVSIIKEEIRERVKSISSGVKNGSLLPSNLYALEAEMLSVEQQEFELEHEKGALISILSELTGTTIAFEAILVLPVVSFEQIPKSPRINREELALFETQKESFKLSKELLTSQKRPRLFAFSQVGYGKPGLNMLNDEFDSYYLVGAGLQWTLWDWKQTKRKRQLLDIKQSVVETKEQHFKQNIRIALEREKENIENYESMIETDKKIIEKREEIIQSARSQLENGVMNATEFLIKLNQKKEAIIRLETHKIELIKSKINYFSINGDL